MDNNDGEIYKEQISKLIKETDDLNLLDLIYKILVEAKK